MEGGDAILHPAFGEEAVRDLCARGLGRRYDKISRLNQTDYLVEFEASDNPTVFAIKLGNRHMWLGMELHMDAHIGITTTLKRVSKQCEEAYTIISNTGKMSSRDFLTMTTSSGKVRIENTPEEGLRGEAKTGIIEEKEDVMLRVLESMSKNIEELD